MKRNKLSFLLAIVLIAALSLTECKKDNPVPIQSPSTTGLGTTTNPLDNANNTTTHSHTTSGGVWMSTSSSPPGTLP